MTNSSLMLCGNSWPGVTNQTPALCVWTLLILLVGIYPISPVSAQAADDGVFELTLDNTDIRTLITAVSRRTGRNFIVDPRVKANVTVISSVPDNERLYEMFLSILDVHGFAAVSAGDFVKIVPMSVAVKSAIPVQGVPVENSAGDEMVSEVIHLGGIPADQLVATLRPLLPESAFISAETSTNSLVITDRAANIAKVIEIVRQIAGVH